MKFRRMSVYYSVIQVSLYYKFEPELKLKLLTNRSFIRNQVIAHSKCARSNYDRNNCLTVGNDSYYKFNCNELQIPSLNSKCVTTPLSYVIPKCAKMTVHVEFRCTINKTVALRLDGISTVDDTSSDLRNTLVRQK